MLSSPLRQFNYLLEADFHRQRTVCDVFFFKKNNTPPYTPKQRTKMLIKIILYKQFNTGRLQFGIVRPGSAGGDVFAAGAILLI